MNVSKTIAQTRVIIPKYRTSTLDNTTATVAMDWPRFNKECQSVPSARLFQRRAA